MARKGINSKRNQPISFLVEFGNAYHDWQRGNITQEEAAKLCGVSTPTFTKYKDDWYVDLQYAIARGEIAYESPN